MPIGTAKTMKIATIQAGRVQGRVGRGRDRWWNQQAYALDFGRISTADCVPKKHTSNSRKKFTCPKMTGTTVSWVQAKAKRTDGREAIVAETTTTRAGACARLLVS